VHTKFALQKLKGTDLSEDLGVDGKIKSHWIFGKWGGRLWTGCILLRIGASEGFYKRRGYLDHLSDC
jgi:hypothetical protein